MGGKTSGEGPRRIVYVLDISLSMETRMRNAERELRAALGELQNGESFGIVTFYGKTKVFNPRLVPATPQSVAGANSWLDRQRLNSGTNLEKALKAALSIPGVNVVVLITDGAPTYGVGSSKDEATPAEIAANFDRLAQRVRELNRFGARIDTVGLVGKNPDGSDDSFEATRLLQTIARESGGQSKLVSSGQNTENASETAPQN